MTTEVTWLSSLRQEVPAFLERLRGSRRPGFYHYSLSGDYFGESLKWGLGNSVFALKIIYTLGLEREQDEHVRNAIEYINSFQRSDGTFADALVGALAFPSRLFHSIKTLDASNLSSKPMQRAETRQAISSLALFDKRPPLEYRNIPRTKEEIDSYLSQLDWRLPWGAGSHFSHLLFFLYHSALPDRHDLIQHAASWIHGLEHETDGCWYKGNPTTRQKINGAMKIITGMNAVHSVDFRYPKKLIDFCLAATNDEDACDNFNVIYALHNAVKLARGDYRAHEVRQFALERLSIYKSHYYPRLGGFAFFPHRANTYYYGARLTRGLDEPDIHGTVMFLWGISIISQVLGLQSRLGFKEFRT